MMAVVLVFICGCTPQGDVTLLETEFFMIT